MAAVSIRMTVSELTRGSRDPIAAAQDLMRPNEKIRKAIDAGLQQLVYLGTKERFQGKGPFPVSQHRLGNVTGRLKQDLYAGKTVISGNGYIGKAGSSVTYFGIHEFGFVGNVSVRAHIRARHTLPKKKMSRLEQSVRAHSRKLNIPARAPFQNAIADHGQRLVVNSIRQAIQSL